MPPRRSSRHTPGWSDSSIAGNRSQQELSLSGPQVSESVFHTIRPSQERADRSMGESCGLTIGKRTTDVD